MKIWIVRHEYAYDCYEISMVFDSEEKAQSYIKNMQEWQQVYYDIEDYEVE